MKKTATPIHYDKTIPTLKQPQFQFTDITLQLVFDPIMSPFLILITIFIHASKSDERYLIFPTIILSQVNEFNLDTFSCDPVSESPTGSPILIKVHIPFLEFSTVGGYFCKKINHRITCSTGMSGFSFINTNHPEPITLDECKEAILKVHLSVTDPVGLTYPKCGVYSVHVADNPRVSIEYQVVPFNKLDGSLIHHYFEANTCKSSICPTVHPNIYWMGDSTVDQHCNQLTPSIAKLYLDEFESVDYSLIDTVYAPPLPFGNACKHLHYCGIDSYVLEDGTLVIPADEVSSEILKGMGSHLVSCPNSTQVKEVTAYNLAINQDLHNLVNFHIEQCESTISKINDSGNITAGDLIYLSGVYPGRGFGYYLSPDGKLEKYNVNLERIHDLKVNCTGPDNCRVTFLKPGNDDRFVLPNHCFEPTSQLKSLGITCMWLNGIGFSKDDVYYPHAYFSRMINEDYNKALSPVNIYHPSTVRTDTDRSVDKDEESARTKTEYVSVWDYFLRNFIWIMCVIAAIFGVIILCYCIKAHCTSKGNIVPQVNIYTDGFIPKKIQATADQPSNRKNGELIEMKQIGIKTGKSTKLNSRKVNQSEQGKSFASAFV